LTKLTEFVDIHSEAVSDCNNCLLLDSKNPKAYFRKGIALYQLRKFELAKRTLQEGLLCPELSDAQKRGLLLLFFFSHLNRFKHFVISIVEFLF
jgi:hypothetical protein